MKEFADSVDLQLDQKKTVFWANQAGDRSWLRKHDQRVVLHGTDLPSGSGQIPSQLSTKVSTLARGLEVAR